MKISSLFSQASLVSSVLVLFLFSMGFSFVPSVSAFTLTVSPAKKVFEVERGGVIEYDISFTSGESTEYMLRALSYVHKSDGFRDYINPLEIDDPNKTIGEWITTSKTGAVVAGKPTKFPIRIVVPDDAPYGDHFAMIHFEKSRDQTGFSGQIGVSGSIGSIIALKVLGGETYKEGSLANFTVETRERAKNTANVNFSFRNSGTEFFDVYAEVLVFETEEDVTPIKSFSREFTVLPNVLRKVDIPIGALPDDFSEGQYFVQLKLYEYYDGKKIKEFADTTKPFDYFIPLGGTNENNAPQIIEREVVVQSPLVDIVRELGIYIGGFILVLIVMIKVLFFGGDRSKK
ncbi:MAG: hypothetical protein P1V18_03355 [Candidatus Gracilibacteria bacterium]|nr:hypothetical protein [Candidatus Gracilibacteria bacterium]